MVVKKTRTPSLKVLYEGRAVANLSYAPERDLFGLHYTAEWQSSGFPLSPHLPLHLSPQNEIPSDNIKKFLENLLPEEDGLRRLAQILKIERSSIYALILALGRDATGAFSFVAENEVLKTGFREISIDELTERVRNRATVPISVWDGKPRLSLAGAQEKLGVTLRAGVYGLGDGDLASTHILKFGSRNQHLVLNEYFCMKLAELVGRAIRDVEFVAKVELLDFGERVLQVERFDRYWKGRDRVVRRHLIDGCQALNVPPTFKYQRIIPVGPERDHYMGPINVGNLSLFCEKCKVPAKARLRVLRWILLNLLIGNSDNHGKNISYFVDEFGFEVAPMYDLVNVTLYDELNHELAFKIGDAFDFNDVKAPQLAELARDMNLEPRFVANQLKRLCEAVLKQCESPQIEDQIEGLDESEKLFLKKLKNNIQARTRRFMTETDRRL